MGLQIIIKGANFSANGYGNISDALIIQNFIINSGITDGTLKSEISKLYYSLKTAGVLAKADAIYPLVGNTALSQSVNLKNPALTDAAYRITWGNDSSGAHTNAGFIGNSTALRYGDTHYVTPLDVSSFFIGAFNSTSENATGDHLLIAANANATAGNGAIVAIGRSFVSRTWSNIARQAVAVQAVTGYDRTKTGLLLLNRTSASSAILYDSGVNIAQDLVARDCLAVGTPTRPLLIGAFSDTGASNYIKNHTDATLNFVIFGKVGLTNTEITQLNTIVTTFNSAIGR